jgi:GT2 family glycosyltransferase
MPARNACGQIERCLDALLHSDFAPLEIIVVDDESTDETAATCEAKGVEVVRLARRLGPGGARNVGSERARGEILLFVDADVVAAPDTVLRVASLFAQEPEVGAVFGSYDAEPDDTGFFSQYKNLYHHFTHQSGNRDASTFWAGCGAVRRTLFLEVGGFDAARYSYPSVEDIELGYRLRAAGHRIVLDRDIQVKHLKQWTLRSWLHADVVRRAIPWSMLLLERGALVDDLNISVKERLRAAVAVGLLAAAAVAVVDARALVAVAALVVASVLGNFVLARFFFRHRGPAFAAMSLAAHTVYYLYSSATFAVCWGCWTAMRLGRHVGLAGARVRGGTG